MRASIRRTHYGTVPNSVPLLWEPALELLEVRVSILRLSWVAGVVYNGTYGAAERVACLVSGVRPFVT